MRAVLLVVAVLSSMAQSLVAQGQKEDFSNDSLEQLTQVAIKVSSVSRKTEDLWDTPAAVYVITREEIANSAASSIPELLREVPGLQVAQITASAWAVSARGFNSAFANKLLVLVDGRTMYSEIYSGAHWDEIDLPLNTVERIEVVRGPGAAVWGTNAVNGVINIITRQSRAVTGFNAQATVSGINDSLVLQDGRSVGERGQARSFFNYVDRRPLQLEDGTQAFDGESMFRGGARMDFQKSPSDRFTFSADAYGGHLRQQILTIIDLPISPNGQEHDSILGGFGLARWEHFGTRNNAELQGYYANDVRHELGSTARMRTTDLEAVDHILRTGRLDLVAGSELRFTEDQIQGEVAVTTKSRYFNYLLSGFVQGEYSVVPQRLQVTFGTKIQDGTLAGFQTQPSLRLIWTPDSRQSLWSAVSRAVVAPAIQDKSLDLPLDLGSYDGLALGGTLLGNAAYKPETVVATELGYRRRFPKNLSLDIASFFNETRRIQSLDASAPAVIAAPTLHLQENLVYGNGYSAHSEGIETALAWRPISKLRFRAGYTWIEAQLTQKQSGDLSIIDSFQSPRNTVTASAMWQITRSWSLSGLIDRVGSLPSSETTGSTQTESSPGSMNDLPVPAYTRLDFHLLRKLGAHTGLEAGATNLLQSDHREFSGGTSFLAPAYIARTFFVRGTWSF